MFSPLGFVQTQLNTPIGQVLLVASDQGLHAVGLSLDVKFPVDHNHPILKKTKQQLEEYFAGKRQQFELPLAAKGTEFQQRAWAELRQIPYGKTVSYREQAGRLGDAKKARAVGFANSQNPILIINPCHRVIAADGSLGGYSGGLEIKKFLLNLERAF